MFFKKYLTKKRIEERRNKQFPHMEFTHAMDFVNQTLKYENNKEDKIIILDFILNVIRKDLQYDTLNTILYSSEYFTREIRFLLPIYYYDKDGNEFDIYNEKGYKDIDLSEECVLVISWNRDRIRNSIKNIYKNDFEYHASNHLAYYFTHIDICHVYNGTHSISSGIGHKKGIIKAKKCDIVGMFEHVNTDGKQWFNTHNNLVLNEVFDFRIAILYEIAKIKYNLTNNSLK